MQKGNTTKMNDPANAGKQTPSGKQDDIQNNQAGQKENAGTEEDGSPVLDEQDLEENDITDEEADDVEWDENQEEREETEGEEESDDDDGPSEKTPGSSGL